MGWINPVNLVNPVEKLNFPACSSWLIQWLRKDVYAVDIMKGISLDRRPELVDGGLIRISGGVREPGYSGADVADTRL